MKTITADSWSISAEDFPANGATPEKWKFFLSYAVLAPSSHNSQPWLFHVRNNTLELYADHHVATGSPVLAVLGTDGDQRRDWVASGQALDRVLLRARVEGVWASFLNQPLEVPELRTKLKAVTGHGGFPQAVLRLGFGENVKPTPRREVEEVLI